MGKGSNTTTTNQQSTYQPNPQAGSYINNALFRASNAADQPFQAPVAPVAGFSNDQQSAFDTVRGGQGMALPYINSAANMFGRSAQGPDVSAFFNPFAGAVAGNMEDLFGQQRSQNTGDLTQAAGGVGADRIAVGQAELAKQQGLAMGQTMANVYAPSLSAAQQQQQILQAAGYGMGALGPAAQNSVFSGAQAQLGTGGLQQQLNQAQQNAPYQNILARLAYPFQTSNFLSGTVGSLAPGLGGTTSGTGSTTAPAPNLFSQLLGLGTAGAGLAGGFGAFNGSGSKGSGTGDGSWYGPSSVGGAPLSGYSVAGGPNAGPYSAGGSVNPYACGGAAGDDGQVTVTGRPVPNPGSPPSFGGAPPPGASAPVPQPSVPTPPQMQDPGPSQWADPSQAKLTSYAPSLSPPQQAGFGSPAFNPPPQPGGFGNPSFVPPQPHQGGFGAKGSGQTGYDSGGSVSDEPIDIAPPSIVPEGKIPAIKPTIPQLNLTPPKQSSGSSGGPSIGDVAKIAMMFAKRGGRIDPKKFDGYNPYAFAEGGATLSDMTARGRSLLEQDRDNSSRFKARIEAGGEPASMSRRDVIDFLRKPPNGYAAGGSPDDDDGPATFDERFPYRAPSAGAQDDWRSGADSAMAFAGDDTAPRAVTRAAKAAPAPSDSQDVNPYSPPTASPAEGGSRRDPGFAGSPWAALMAAGLGMAAGKSPFALTNIGTGGLEGLKTLESQRAASQKDETIDQAARRLAQEAEFHKDQYTKMTPYQREHMDLMKQDASFKQMQPVKIGTDFLGHDIYARKDPKTGEYISTITGKPIDPATVPGGITPTPRFNLPGQPESSNDDSALPPHARVTQGVTVPEGVNPEVLAQLPAGLANKIKAVDEGRMSISQAVGFKDRAAFADLVNQYDPKFDQTVWTVRNKQQADMSTNGNAGKMILAVNQLLPHLKKASDNAAALQNGDFKGINAIVNWAKDATGSPLPGNFETVREVAAMDAARLLRGSGQMAEQDIEFWRKNLSTAGSPEQLQEKIKLLADDLMGARISSIQQSYRTNMRMEPPDFVSKEAKEALETIKTRVKPTAAQPAAPGAAAAEAAPAVGTTKQFKQGWGVWNGKAWEPE